MMKTNILCWIIILLTASVIVEAFVLHEQAEIIYDQQMSIELAPPQSE